MKNKTLYIIGGIILLLVIIYFVTKKDDKKIFRDGGSVSDAHNIIKNALSSTHNPKNPKPLHKRKCDGLDDAVYSACLEVGWQHGITNCAGFAYGNCTKGGRGSLL